MQARFYEKSSGFAGQIEGFLAILEDRLMEFSSVKFRREEIPEERIIHLFYFKFQEIPLLARMDAVREYFVDEYETLHGKQISEEDAQYLREQFDRMYVSKDIYEIYNWLLEELGYQELPDVEMEKRLIEYEDVYPMLYLKYRLKGGRKHKHIKHLVIDEMQDYSYMQYMILAYLFDCRMTILGDRAQTLDTKIQDVLMFLPKIYGKKMRKIVMNKSYRNTLEIARYAKKIAGEGGLEFLERHGREVVEQSFDSDEEMIQKLKEELRVGPDGFETAAVITMTQEEAEDISRLLKNRGIDVNYIDRDSTTFRKGVTVTTFYMAKGLEFDQVFTLIREEGNPLLKQAKYICATRALHELYMYTVR